MAYPPEEEELTLDAIYERKLKMDISIVENRVVLYEKDHKTQATHKIDVHNILQWLID
jgi:hypothetical protein